MKNILFITILSMCFQISNATTQQEGIVYNKVHSSTHNASDPGSLSPQFSLMQKEISRLETIKNKGGWGTIKIPAKKIYRKGHSNSTIKQLKQRLYASGDLSNFDTSGLYNDELVEVVKKVQRRHGFKDDGRIYTEFVKELNIPVEKRIQQVKLNMERLEKLPPSTSGTRLIANIPEFKLHVYEGDKHVFDMAIVVGKESSKTVSFTDEMKHIVFAPYWNVPSSIVRNELLPAMKRDRTYLKRNRYEVVGNENGLPKIRQKSGKSNSLGLVKFIFPNSHNIYFHDTPAKSLFQTRKRTFSHGCIRLAEPEKLAQYLLRNQSQWNEANIRKAMNSGKEQWVALDQPVPVVITYITSWVDENGELNFREDVYRKDNIH